jgi:hypothetical protein
MRKLLLLAAGAVFLGGGAFAQAAEKADLAAVFSRFQVKFYGYLKFDVAWDDSRTEPGNFVKWVENEAVTEDDPEMNVTANQSRFGFDIGGPESDRIETGGRFEVDFYGGGPGENKANPRMRHAYLWVRWKERDLELIAGQTWDLVGLKNYCPTINLHPGWWAGNIGFRHAQLTVHKTWKMEEHRLEGAFGLTRTIGTDSGFGPGDSGEDNDFPTLQGRLGLFLPLLAGEAMFALSGHYGGEEYDTAVGDRGEDFDSWSLCFDFTLPLHERVKLNGCFFTGENLDDYYGGIGQGVNTTTSTEIASTGGFINLCLFNLVPSWHFNFGFGIDDPDNDDLNANDRARNMNVYGNAKYWLMEDLMAGLEVAYWETDYLGVDEAADAIRFQFAMQYWF